MTTALLLMWAKSLWDKFMGYIITAGIIIAAFGFAFLKGRSAGKRMYREKHEKLQKKAIERTNKIKEVIDNATEKENQKRMEKYYRD